MRLVGQYIAEIRNKERQFAALERDLAAVTRERDALRDERDRLLAILHYPDQLAIVWNDETKEAAERDKSKLEHNLVAIRANANARSDADAVE